MAESSIKKLTVYGRTLDSVGVLLLEEKDILAQLEELAENLGLMIRYEKIKKESAFFPGGFCRLKGEGIIIINSTAGIGDKIDVLAKDLAAYDLSCVYIRPALREFLARYSRDQSDESEEP